MSSHLPKNPSVTSLAKALPWDQATDEQLQSIRGVCLDIDDTLSSSGKLTAEAFQSLWDLKNAGFAVVPITGRPAGWCDHIARFWPVDAVVGENGAFVFYMDGGIRRRINTPAGADDATLKSKLNELSEKIRARFNHAKWASDQDYREYDLAVDICEDVPTWPDAEVEELIGMCKKAGAHAKLSSIHVNIWFGEYDKRKGFENWVAQGHPGLKGSALKPAEWLYIGDSPNDEPMFASFQSSVGVANLNKYLTRIQSPPSWITSQESGRGFAQMARRLVQLKSKKG